MTLQDGTATFWDDKGNFPPDIQNAQMNCSAYSKTDFDSSKKSVVHVSDKHQTGKASNLMPGYCLGLVVAKREGNDIHLLTIFVGIMTGDG